MTKDDAKQLAVRYAAYLQSFYDEDDSGIAVWGDMLIETQAKVGVELLKPETIRAIVAGARRRMLKAVA
jgi:hypothetical protein